MSKRRNADLRKERVISTFLELIRSGAAYTAEYMYEKAADAGLIATGSAANIVRQHYRETVITQGMREFESRIADKPYEDKVEKFAKEYYLCKREAKLILRYMYDRFR